MSANNPVPKIYRAVIEDVIKNVKESFLNEGVDEQVLNELKQLWENKLLQSRAVDFMPTDVNVKVSLRYPLTAGEQQGSSSQAGSSQQRQQQQQKTQQQQKQQQQKAQPQQQPPPPQTVPQPQLQPATAARIVHTAAGGQFVYVSQHPTLGNVGPMSGAAAQAAMALQNQRLPRAIIPPIVGMQPGQVFHIQPQQGQPQMYSQFPPGVAPRVIYAPAAAVTQAQPPTSEQKQQATRIIQVDGASDTLLDLQTNSRTKHEDAITINIDNLKTTDSNSKEKTNQRPTRPKKRPEIIIQFDGANNSDSDDDDDDDEEDYDNIPVAGIGAAGGDEEELGEEEEPLNSEDDVSDEDPMDLFDTDNVVVCQYDKIARTRNRWKFHLKDGIMNLKSKDYVFHKANGDAEW